MDVGVSMGQVKESPIILELTTQIVLYRTQKLASYGYDVRSGSLDVIVETKKDFEMSYGKLPLRQQRPLFNPVAPLRSAEEAFAIPRVLAVPFDNGLSGAVEFTS
ncbi:hypothetical protein FQN60_005855 [Etheostoma spectabile]|uniref:Uncharacterized protein n=1 Tax=Etheostoma spectabile TaxID=54343 RepID=A0A5J5CJA2_9PERO|nr:hypothetical protein FQN60_005855 [Etheostoma spectabile]